MEFTKDKIKLLRESLSLTQKQLAKKLSVKRQTVACWETGRRNPSPEIVAKLEKLSTENVDSENVDRNVDSEFVDSEIVDRNVDRKFVDRNVDRKFVDREENATKAEQSEQQIITPAEYFEAAYREADGYIVLCAITQPPKSDERGKLIVKGAYATDSIPNLLQSVKSLNGKYHLYTNRKPLRVHREAVVREAIF